MVTALGVLLALIANRISHQGLSLSRNYFPEIKTPPPPAVAVTNSTPIATPTNTAPPSVAESAAARLKSKGLQLVTLDQVKQLLRDPGFEQGKIIFVDARGDEHYQAGHIPGAYQLDYYHPEKYIAAVLPLCQTATNIVVYCTGGECEDSEMTAVTLRDTGVPNAKLFVYPGGITEWEASKQPVETGARNSDQIRETPK